LFLNQILDEYKTSSNKQDIIDKFIDRLWKSEYGFKKYKKQYKYEVFDELLDNRKDLIELFNKYSVMEYTVCRSFYKKKLLETVDYIRIRINNMYGFLFDKDVYYNKKYYNLLLTPKKEYFRLVNLKKENGNIDNVSYEEVYNNIVDALKEAEVIKQESIDKKHNVIFSNYKRLINTYISRIFDNYISIEDYEKNHKWEQKITVDGWSENNYVIKYFCKSLTGYMRTYIRNVIKNTNNKECKVCKILFPPTNNKSKYCPTCAKEIKFNQKKEWDRTKRIRKIEKPCIVVTPTVVATL